MEAEPDEHLLSHKASAVIHDVKEAKKQSAGDTAGLSIFHPRSYQDGGRDSLRDTVNVCQHVKCAENVS